MGDTYERVSETRIERGLQQRAELLVEYESMMLIKNASNGFGSWLHAIQRKDAAGAMGAMGEGDVWAGQLRRIKDDVKSLKAKVESGQQEIKAELKTELAGASVKADVAEMKVKVDELLNLLRARGGDLSLIEA